MTKPQPIKRIGARQTRLLRIFHEPVMSYYALGEFKECANPWPRLSPTSMVKPRFPLASYLLTKLMLRNLKEIEIVSRYEGCPLPRNDTVVIVDVHPEIASKLAILDLSSLLTWYKPTKYRKQTNG